MRKLLTIALVLLSGITFGQTDFRVDHNGITDYVVTEIPNKNAKEIYSLVLEWVNKNYNNPSQVIQSKKENEYIRIMAVSANVVPFVSLHTMYMDLRYQIEIAVKDEKFKLEIISMEKYSEPSQYGMGGYFLINFDHIYKSNKEVRRGWKLLPEALETKFNELNTDISDFIKYEKTSTRKDW